MLLLCGLLLAGAGLLAWAAFAPDSLPGFADSGVDASGTSAKAEPVQVAALPVVAEVRYLDVLPDDARKINASVPFSTRPNPAASPLRLQLAAADSERATDCLAAAAWYEAGDDAIGQQAVVQVVLNRLRHPSFPKTVCGVVFQGSERKTGCQFSFTCDGALNRTPAPAAWTRARTAASAALAGYVFGNVGWSTHYHTDWVVPYWSSAVDKTAQVRTHLFFRWQGAAGNPGAFTGRHAGAEPFIAALARLSTAHLAPDANEVAMAGHSPTGSEAGTGTGAAPPIPEAPVSAAALRGSALVARDVANNSFTVSIGADVFSGDLAMMALDLCNLRSDAPCTVTASFAGSGAPDFHYFRDRSRGRETALWNCARMKRTPKQCMPANFRP